MQATEELIALADEQQFYESVVHGLRSRGWSRVDAEGEALERVERIRARAQVKP